MVDRVAGILEQVARSPEPLTLTDIARALDAPVSSIQGLVNGLTATGYLDKYDRRYVLGTAPYLLNLIGGRPIITKVTHDILKSLFKELGMTVLLATVVGTDVFYIDSCSEEPRYDYLSRQLIRRSLIRTSAGWVLLSSFSRSDLWAYLSSLPEEDSTRIQQFLRSIDTISCTGFCVAPATSDIADGVSVAIREHNRIVGALSVVGPIEEVHARRDELVNTLSEYRKKWESV